MKFELIKDNTGRYRWRLLANSGDPICNSVSFLDRLEAIESINSVRAWSKEAPISEVDLTKKSDWMTEAIKSLRDKHNERHHQEGR